MYEVLSLNPGLILLRYKKQGSQSNAIIRPVIPADQRGALSIMFDPAARNEALSAPGEVCVLRCVRPAKLGIEISSRQPGVPPRGSIEVEYLAQPSRNADAMDAYTPVAAPAPEFDYAAHFHLLGDQLAAFGEWLEGDGETQGIEGLCIQPVPGLPRVMMRDLASGQTAAPGEFLGTRGRFRPLTAVEIWIDGPPTHVIHMEARLRNAGEIMQSGTFLTLRGMEPDEKLLGIKLRIVPRAGQDQPAAPAFKSVQAQPVRNERVKIFRK